MKASIAVAVSRPIPIASNCFFRYYHFKCVWSAMSKVPKITSLLFLCNILKQT